MASVLVAEDDQDHQRLIAGVVRRLGHDVTVADDGRAALVAAAHRRPDLVVADVDMPEMDGLQLCRALRGDPVLADVPVVLVTALSMIDERRLRESGARAVIRKPFTLQQLSAALVPHLAQGEPPRKGRPPLVRDPALEQVFVEALLQSTDTGLCACDATGRMIMMNTVVRGFFGDDSAGIPLQEWAQHFALRHHDGSPLLAYDLPISRALRGEVVEHAGLLATDRRGRPRWLTINARPVCDPDGAVVGAVAAVHDITGEYKSSLYQACTTEVLKALAESRSAAEAHQEVVRTIGGTLGWRYVRLWLVDPVTGRLRLEASYTGPHERPLPAPASIARGQGLAGLCWQRGELVWVPDIHAADAPILPEVVAGSRFRAAGAVPVRSGEHVSGVLTFFSYDPQEPEPALAVLLTGIAGSVGAHLQQHRADDLEHHLAAATDEYIALVGHELRTPLTSIGAYVELIAEAPELTPELRGLAEVVDRNSRRLRQLVDQLLDLAALDGGHIGMQTCRVDLTELVAAAADTVRGPAADRRIVIDTNLAPDIVVPGDRGRLRQVADNLLDNAIKFSYDGATVSVQLTGDEETVVLTISDTGMGLSDEEQPDLFRRLHRGDNVRHSGIPGNGLGLALCRAVVEHHQGTITLSREHPTGTAVTVRLPRTAG
ncbi:ATP-binding protein [Actinoplanes sp. NPDC051859]|uniref:ATP-binding protein n=1 Tax=Actinoplanes sp. NPDC051859 TaxID=3363909 RepID=UPI0037B1FD19